MKKTRAAGGGRKPLYAEKTTKVAITLLPEQVEAMKQLGNGNLSAGIRKAIEMTISTYTIRETVESNQRIWYVVYNGTDWGRYERGTDAWNAANQMATKNAENSGGTLEQPDSDTWIIHYPVLTSPFHNKPVG